MEALKWIHLVGGILLFMALWQRQAAPATTVGAMFRWQPIWKQRQDFTCGGWIMWVSGWALIIAWIVASIAS